MPGGKDWDDDYWPGFAFVEGREAADHEANSVEPVCGDDGQSRLRRESVSSPT